MTFSYVSLLHASIPAPERVVTCEELFHLPLALPNTDAGAPLDLLVQPLQVGVDPGRGASLATGPFPRAALRTGRARSRIRLSTRSCRWVRPRSLLTTEWGCSGRCR
jgi:hypothetical protein